MTYRNPSPQRLQAHPHWLELTSPVYPTSRQPASFSSLPCLIICIKNISLSHFYFSKYPPPFIGVEVTVLSSPVTPCSPHCPFVPDPVNAHSGCLLRDPIQSAFCPPNRRPSLFRTPALMLCVSSSLFHKLPFRMRDSVNCLAGNPPRSFFCDGLELGNKGPANLVA